MAKKKKYNDVDAWKGFKYSLYPLMKIKGMKPAQKIYTQADYDFAIKQAENRGRDEIIKKIKEDLAIDDSPNYGCSCCS